MALGVILLAVFLFARANLAQAQSTSSANGSLQEGVQVISQPLGLPTTDIRVIIVNIIKTALGLLGIILLVISLYGGYLWMTAGGNEEQIAQAKKVLVNAVIGLAIILSAYAIVAFVAQMLGIGQGGGGQGTGINLGAPGTQNFSGSGALGGIIKDHYPARNQTAVPRNTKIVVTFRKPVLASSFITDTNGDGVYGNCRDPFTSWADCDHAKLDNDHIMIKQAGTSTPISAAVVTAVSTTINGISGVYTIVIKPITDPNASSGGYLGSDTNQISYIVHLGSGMQLDDQLNNNPSAFSASSIGNNYYEWQFTCSTELDLTPPHVVDVFPAQGVTEARNSVVQIDFSKPIDPTGIEGKFNNGTATDPAYFLDGQNIFLKADNSTVPPGSFHLVNGYRTLEFTPSQVCGTNTCGGKIYCLPVCDKAGANCSQDNYQFLLKAARAISSSTFEAIPLSGVMDLSGNVLDGNNNSKVEFAPTAIPVFDHQLKPDNYFWDFNINNQIDATSPYLRNAVPGLDADSVKSDQEWSVTFNKRMRLEPLYDVVIDEKPTPAERRDNIPLCKVPITKFNADNSTYTNFSHCPFLTGAMQYYFPIVTSTIEDVHFNCFYPGKGPGGGSGSANVPDAAVKADPVTKLSPTCAGNGDNCCDVITATNKSTCCNGSTQYSNTQACRENLENSSIIIPTP